MIIYLITQSIAIEPLIAPTFINFCFSTDKFWGQIKFNVYLIQLFIDSLLVVSFDCNLYFNDDFVLIPTTDREVAKLIFYDHFDLGVNLNLSADFFSLGLNCIERHTHCDKTKAD
jgi:hypothetical protein